MLLCHFFFLYKNNALQFEVMKHNKKRKIGCAEKTNMPEE